MVEPNIQLLMTPESITITTSMFEGVLTKKTFEGPDCYLRMVESLKEFGFADRAVYAIIVVR